MQYLHFFHHHPWEVTVTYKQFKLNVNHLFLFSLDLAYKDGSNASSGFPTQQNELVWIKNQQHTYTLL